MHYDFLIGRFIWNVQLDDNGMYVRSGTKERHVSWSELTGAGISAKRTARRTPGLPTGVAIFPGLGMLDEFARRMRDTTELLLIAYRDASGGKKLLTMNIPSSGDIRDSLVDELRGRLGARWLGDGFDQLALRKALGLSNWWVKPAAAAAVTVVAAMLFGWWYLLFTF
jgi:hypothetical protein